MRTGRWVVLGSLWFAALAGASDGGVDTPAAEVTPLQNEMRELNAAMLITHNALANNKLEEITPAIVRVHAARNLTEAALERHEVKLPKNADKMKAFVKQDNEFHGELFKLVKAAKSKDLTAATKQFGVVLNGCAACHVKFRF